MAENIFKIVEAGPDEHTVSILEYALKAAMEGSLRGVILLANAGDNIFVSVSPETSKERLVWMLEKVKMEAIIGDLYESSEEEEE